MAGKCLKVRKKLNKLKYLPENLYKGFCIYIRYADNLSSLFISEKLIW